MAVPKRKKSKSRRRSRYSKWLNYSAPEVVECNNCHSNTLPHRACPVCGHYKGMLIVEEK